MPSTVGNSVCVTIPWIVGCELDADLLLLRGREDVDQTVDRGGRVLRVQGREDEVAGLGRGDRGRDRLEVAHLAEEDHVRVLAKRAAQGVGEADGVGPDLALVDDAALVAVEELDRVLDGHDVVVARAVDLVDDGRERRRLTGARRARDEDEAARLLRKLVELRRQAEILERLQLGGDHAEGRAEALALEIDVDAEAREARDRVRDVDLPVDLQVLLLLGREDAVEQPLGVVSGEARELVEPLRGCRSGG